MKKIIWVDNDINRSELRADLDELRERDCEIIPIEDTDIFLEKLRHPKDIYDFDCIILDLSMPVGSEYKLKDASYGSRTGLLLMKEIRDSYLLHNAKIIVYSIVDDKDVEKECDAAGVLYLKKTGLLSHEFADKVIDWLTKK